MGSFSLWELGMNTLTALLAIVGISILFVRQIIGTLFPGPFVTVGEKKVVTFVHLDLGVGGAERLVVDAALGLKSRGHDVVIYTTNHPLDHCFPESRTDLDVRVRCAWVPHRVFGRLQVLMSALRMVCLAWVVARERPSDVMVCDGVSMCVPPLRWLSRAKVLFYCHYPDQLLVQRRSWLRSLYRWPFDRLEAWSTTRADRVVVNSRFTASVYTDTFFPNGAGGAEPQVVYPCVDTSTPVPDAPTQLLGIPDDGRTLLVSINRFERKKDVALAVEALALLRKAPSGPASPADDGPPPSAQRLQLVIAGGYDPRVTENVEYLRELQRLAERHGLAYATVSTKVADALTPGAGHWPTDAEAPIVFMPDVAEAHKRELLLRSRALLYTPTGEHFGIVPLEAMLHRCPVVAVASGGLLETVTEDRKVGLLGAATGASFADMLRQLLDNPQLARRMGEAGRQRVLAQFSRRALADSLDAIVQELSAER